MRKMHLGMHHWLSTLYCCGLKGGNDAFTKPHSMHEVTISMIAIGSSKCSGHCLGRVRYSECIKIQCRLSREVSIVGAGSGQHKTMVQVGGLPHVTASVP